MHFHASAALLRRLLLLALVDVTVQIADQHVLDIRKIVRPEIAVPSIDAAVAHALSKPSECVPDGGIMLSVTNKHHGRLRPLQFAFFHHRPCFMHRVVSVCFNNVTDAFGTCVRSTFVIPPSDFRRSNYANLIWAKWRIISDALYAGARTAMWFDADVLILRNPWTALHLLGSSAASAPVYDIRYQSEPPPVAEQHMSCSKPLPVCPDCASINGGQLVVTNARIAAQIYAARPRNLSNTDRLDQDWVDAIIHNSSHFRYLLGNSSQPQYSQCVLPASFVAECWSTPSFKRARSPSARKRGARSAAPSGPECSQVTHHFNCLPTRRDKQARMKLVIEQWQKTCGNYTD